MYIYIYIYKVQTEHRIFKTNNLEGYCVAYLKVLNKHSDGQTNAYHKNHVSS